MPEGYCVKCKAKKEIVDAVEETMKNGRKAIKGKCPTCGTVMFKILGGKASPPSVEAAAVEPAKVKPPAASVSLCPNELAYVIITPYSLHKSRTGGILTRLITRTGCELVSARMFAPSAELVKAYAEETISANDPQDRRIQELIYNYILRNLLPDPKTGRRRRLMMLLFQGEEAVRKTRSVVGNVSADRRVGETIRDTYGDLIIDEHDELRYFEPAVLASPTRDEAEMKLKLWARYSDTDGGLLENIISYQPGEQPERTLVLIKPENFRFPTGRPGNMVDFFSRTGLFIVGVKVHRMSVSQALQFYGPVRETLRTRLKDVVAARATTAIEKELGFKLGSRAAAGAGEHSRPLIRRQPIREHCQVHVRTLPLGMSPGRAGSTWNGEVHRLGL